MQEAPDSARPEKTRVLTSFREYGGIPAFSGARTLAHPWLSPALAATAFGFLLVYLNLIPLRFSVMPMEVWLQRAADLQWLEISLSGRADWVANLFLFIPFGFLLAEALGRNQRSLPVRTAVAVIAAFIVAGVAYGIEILQLFVPQRTVSLNDVVAGTLGGSLGVAAHLIAGDRIRRLIVESLRPGRGALLAGLTLYTLAYVLLSPFPFDFVVSSAEFSRKVQSGNYALWIAGTCSPAHRCVGSLAFEVALVVPIGMALALWRRWQPSPATATLAALSGVLFSIFIESVQFVTFSGISQGISLFTRATGFAIGALLLGWMAQYSAAEAQRKFQLWASALWVPYIFGVFWVVGLTNAAWGTFQAAAEQLQSLNFLPFYYHYFTSEQAAMASLLYTFALFLPAGMLLWFRSKPVSHRGILALVLAVGLALLVEAGKLLAIGLRPDPTNLLIAGFAGWLGLRAMTWFSASLAFIHPSTAASATATARRLPSAMQSRPITTVAQAQNPAFHNAMAITEGHRLARSTMGSKKATRPASTPLPHPPGNRAERSLLAVLAGAGLGLSAIVAAAYHPLSAPLALIGVALVLITTFRWPASWLILVPATLPILDLRPWTGRLYFDEWDLLVLTVLAALFLQRGFHGTGHTSARIAPSGRIWIGLYLLSYTVALLWVLWPPAWPEPFEFTTLHSDFHGLRLAKGVLWALLLWPFFHRVLPTAESALNRFAAGMILGLAAAVASVIWERLVFTGLLDFSQDYRVTGLFSDTHTGGAFLEAYLVAAVPFLVAMLLWRRRWLWGTLAAVLFVLATYAVAVTFARAGYAGLVAGVLVVLAALIHRSISGPGIRWAALAVLLVVMGSGTALLLHIQDEDFMGPRLDPERIQNDLDTRLDHWKSTLRPVLRDTQATWIGLGVGRFPEVHFWELIARGEPAPSIYWVDRDSTGDAVLNLTSGLHTYHWQAIATLPDTEYQAWIRLRNPGPEQSRLGLMLCEQWLIYSRRCVWRNLRVEPGENYQILNATLRSHPPLTAFTWVERPVKLVLFHLRGTTHLEIERVSLTDPAGRELLANGDFERALDHWFFASDDHLEWHIKHLFAQVFFEQGLLGLGAWILLVLAALWSVSRKLPGGGSKNLLNAALLASLLSFLIVGLFDSLFDAPRLATLYFLLLLIALSVPAAPAGRNDVGNFVRQQN